MPTLINPEHIYPRRLGIYRFNSLVIEYYNFEKDVIKKHVIPFDPEESAKKNLQAILKNPKHSVFLRKVSPEDIQKVLSGQSALSSYEQEQLRDSFTSKKNTSSSIVQNKSSSLKKSSINQKEYESSFNKSESYSQAFQDYGNSMSVAELDFRQKESYEQQEKKKEKSEQKEEQDYYDQQFQQFSGQTFPKQVVDVIEEVEKKQEETEKKEQKKQEKKKQKAKKQKKQQNDDAFEFLDEEKKKKKKKKGKKGKKDKKKKESKESSVVDDTPIEEQFDFL